MDVARFDFTLPDRLVALRPAVPRESARLMTVPADGPVGHRRIDDLPRLLRAADGLVVNDTRVIPARLRGRRRRQGSDVAIEVLLHRRLGAARWLAFARPGKRLAVGDRIAFGPDTGDLACQATVEEKAASGEIDIVFDKGGADLDAAIAVLGEMPLPPYIESRRPSDAADRTDYQTVYAREPGAVAAPTAGLHLTEGLLARLGETGLSRHAVTLHVGAGTFLPVKAQDTADHRMHAEWGEVTAAAADALNAVRATGGRIVAIGTTALRLLESATDPNGVVKPFRGETEIFITPGYRFRAVDALLTNFHLPRSTLFMLVSAFAGLDRMQAAYGEAIAAGYRFYSYGDACLIERAEPA